MKKHIILAICGSISAYKSIEILRLLIKEGHEVKIILTRGALHFLNPSLFKHLGATATFLPNDDFNFASVLHVELANWADVVLIAPASANTISKLASGIADDLLGNVFLASVCPILFFPAMNEKMLQHDIIQNHIAKLSQIKNIQFFETDTGVLACGEEGFGKLLPVEEIVQLVSISLKPKNLNNENKTILISTGATICPLDPVRYLTNSSSGITGFYLAKELLSQGYRVHVVAGKESTGKLDLLSRHPCYTMTRVTTVNEMFENISHTLNNVSIHAYVGAAAISDFEFNYCEDKIKKDQMSSSIPINPAIDILSAIIKSNNKPNLVIGFAAETNLTEDFLQNKMTKKPVDFLIGTSVNNGLMKNGQQVSGFNQEFASYLIMDRSRSIIYNGHMTKSDLATKIAECLQ